MPKNEYAYIERRITIGLLISTEFIRKVVDLYDPQFIRSEEARLVNSWAFNYYEQYDQAPGHDIESIFMEEAPRLDKAQAEFIEDILDSMADEIERETFNLAYLEKQAKQYFRRRKLDTYVDRVKSELQNDDIDRAEEAAENFRTIDVEENDGTIPFDEPDKLREAFESDTEPLISMGGALGYFMDSTLVRDGFVPFLGSNKVGKTWWLQEMGMRAQETKKNVVFFQAGDMSEKQQLRRMAVRLARRSYRRRYCNPMYIPVLDCLHNQMDTCSSKLRDCDRGIFEKKTENEISELPMKAYVQQFKDNPEYEPCTSCRWERRSNFKGAVWYVHREAVEPLSWKEAYRKGHAWNKRYGKRFRLFTYPNRGLTVSMIARKLDSLEKKHGFVADVVIVDYMDLLAPDKAMPREFRHSQDAIWGRMRGLSQERQLLILSATQADAKSYGKHTLSRANFSEDRRKLDHVTAMYGLNTTELEKGKKIQRINEIVLREDEFSASRQVHVLQCLQIGRPYIESFVRNINEEGGE